MSVNQAKADNTAGVFQNPDADHIQSKLWHRVTSRVRDTNSMQRWMQPREDDTAAVRKLQQYIASLDFGNGDLVNEHKDIYSEM